MDNTHHVSSSPSRPARSLRPRSLLRAFLPLAAIASLTTACSGDDDAAAASPKDDTSPATWTLFVYGHADHNLSVSLLRDIREMTKADLTEDVRVVVAADWDASAKLNASGESFSEGTEWYLIRGGGEPPQELGAEPEQNLDDPAVLAAAVQRAFERYPATRRGLILWDHGGSWLGGFGGDSQNGTGAPQPMDPASLAKAVRDGLDAAGIQGERPLDFVSFDTCLMGSTEVAFELRDLAQTYIANAELDYGDGWDYKETLSYIARHPEASATDIAVSEVAIWDKHHENSGALMDTLMRSHVAVDLTRYDAYTAALKQLAVVMQDKPGLASTVARASFFSLPNYGVSSPISVDVVGTHYRDAGQFLRALEVSQDEALAGAAKAARVALEDAILDVSQGELREIGQEVGWQLTLPQFSAFFAPYLGAPTDPSLSDLYVELTNAFQQVVPWGAALDAVAVANDGQAPSFSLLPDEAADPQGLSVLKLEITDPDAASGQLSVLRRDPETGALISYGAVAGGTVQNGESYTFEWDQHLVALGEGADAQPVFVTKGPDIGVDARTGETLPAIFTIPGRISAPGQGEALCRLLIEQGTNAASQLVIEDAGNNSVLSIRKLLDTASGVQFTPLLAAVDPMTGEMSTIDGKPITIDSDHVTIGVMPAPAATYEFHLEVRDVFDNVGSSKVEVVVASP